MTSNLKKKKERDLLLEFKALYSEFPRGEITDSEPPDFLIATDNGIIGIELEDYIRGYRLGKGSGGSPIRQSESNQAEFLQATQNIYEAKQLEPLIVDFSCSGHNLIKRSDIKILAEYTVRLIEMALPLEISSHVIIGREQLEDTLLEGYISAIALSKPVGLKSSKWLSNGMSFWELSVGELEKLISYKEQKIDEYLQKCDKAWLLIVADGEYTSSMLDFPKGWMTKSFSTRFEKAFLYDRVGQQVVQLSE